MEVRDQVAEGLRIADFGLKDLFSDESARLNYPIYNCWKISRISKIVMPDESACDGWDPVSSESSMTSFGVWFPAFTGTLSGSRLASAAAGLGRDDELRYSPMRCQGTCSYRAELNKYAFTNFETGNPPEGWESEGQFPTSNFEILIKQWSSSCPSGNFALACLLRRETTKNLVLTGFGWDSSRSLSWVCRRAQNDRWGFPDGH